MRTTSIYAYGQYVCEAASFNEALAHFDISSLVGVYDITDSLIALCESRLGPWPQGGMLVHLTPDDMDAIKAQEAREQDLSWSRAEAQGLAEKLNEAVLEKTKLQTEVSRLKAAEDALGKSLAHVEGELAKARELIQLYEADAEREAQAEEEIEAQMMRDAEAFTMKHPMDGLTPAVSYETPVEPGGIYDESGFQLGSTAPSGGTSPATSPHNGVAANAGEEKASPPPVTQEAAMPFEAPTPGQAAREILKREWAAGTPAPTIVRDILRAVPDAPAWAHDKRRLGIEAARIGVKRPASAKINPPAEPEAVAEPATGAENAQVQGMASRIRKPGPPAHAPIPGLMGVGTPPPPTPVVEAAKPAPVVSAAQSELTRQYGPYVEKLVAKGLSYDDIKRRMNKDLPRDFTREDVKLIAGELGL